MTNTRRNIRAAVVTGPTGAIGQALLHLLCREGVFVYAVVRPGSPRAARITEGPSMKKVECDLSELAKLPVLIPSADAFFHLAWEKTTGEGRNDMQAQVQNIRTSLDAVSAAGKLGARVFIGAGSQAEYGRVSGVLTPDTPCSPENGYGMAKLCAGEMTRMECAKLGIDHIWMRILSVYGPYDGAGSMIMSTAEKLLDKEKPALTKGEQQWDYLYSGDAAEAFRLAALYGKNGKIYTLGSGKARPLRSYVEEMRDAVDPCLPLGFGEIPYSPQQVMHLSADISALAEDTGFTPCTEFSDGIRKTLEYIQRTR